MNFFTRALIFLACIHFSSFAINSTSGKAIIIMGASCSGKSTLSKALLESFGNQWKFVELDAIEDEFRALGKDTSDINLLDVIVAQSNDLLASGWNIIIDTNIYHEILRSISTDHKKFILVHCPLSVLLERNAQRDVILQRSAQRAVRARKYVEKTFQNFENFNDYDVLIDSSIVTFRDINPVTLQTHYSIFLTNSDFKPILPNPSILQSIL